MSSYRTTRPAVGDRFLFITSKDYRFIVEFARQELGFNELLHFKKGKFETYRTHLQFREGIRNGTIIPL